MGIDDLTDDPQRLRPMFFSPPRDHFFRPLNGKYRERVAECLRGLYERLYGAQADYSRRFHREQVLEVFQEAITRAPLLDEAGEPEPPRPERDLAGWVLNQLLEHRWLERLVDEATLQSSYAFTRHGRLFTQPLIESLGGRFRTRHRNTRNTRNALQSFLEGGEVYDLLDAYEYSERIVADFSDLIAELEERKRQLVREVEAQQVVQRATDEFFDFMERRFIPDIAIRLSADSVEKHRDEIQGLIGKARRKPKAFKAQAERNLRRAAPDLLEDPGQSVYLQLLDGVESRMHSAASLMLPALRQALNGFTRRADIIIRQLSYGGASQQGRLRGICERLKEKALGGQNEALEAAGSALAVLDLGLPDPDGLRLLGERRPRRVSGALEAHAPLDRDGRRALYLQQSVELAFAVNRQELHDYLLKALGSATQVTSGELPVESARDLLMVAHLVEASGPGGEAEPLHIEPTGRRVQTGYFEESDEFVIERIVSS